MHPGGMNFASCVYCLSAPSLPGFQLAFAAMWPCDAGESCIGSMAQFLLNSQINIEALAAKIVNHGLCNSRVEDELFGHWWMRVRVVPAVCWSILKRAHLGTVGVNHEH